MIQGQTWWLASLKCGALACMAMAALTGRQWIESAEAMKLSNAAFDQGDLVTSLTEARRAARAYAPGLVTITKAHERMVAIATGSEQMGDRELAVRAWRAVRASALEVRYGWSPFEPERRLAEERLDRLEREGEAAKEGAPGDPSLALKAAVRRSDDLGSSLGVVGCLLAATCGLAWAAWRGLTPAGQWQWRRARWGLLLAGASLASWSALVLRA